MTPVVEFDFTDDEADYLQVMGELSWLVDKAWREEHGMRFGIDLDEAQIRAANVIAEHHGLVVEEAIEHIVLMGLQEATLAMTRPGIPFEELQKTLHAHSERIVGELKLRRQGRDGQSGLIRP